MDKWQGLQSFWGSFSIPAYDENSVPDDAVMPYITYSASVGTFENPVVLNASVWYKSTSWEPVSLKVEEIAQSLQGHKLIKLDDGQYIYLAQGSPFAQRMSGNDDLVRRVYLVVMGEYLVRY